MSARAWPSLVAVVATALLGLVSGRAEAQLIVQRPERYASPQRFALELRVGPYAPEVDEEFGGRSKPHENFYGTGRRPMYQLELDYQFFRGFGSAAVGVGVGYFRQSALAPVDDGKGTDVDVVVLSADKSVFSLYPMSVVLVYRADQLYRMFKVPLVPYAKAGLGYTIWSAYNGNDEVATGGKTTTGGIDGGRGRGGTLGWQAAVGISLVLDFIDPGAARALDGETGVNHTHAFFELAKFEISGLGQDNRLHVGDSTWLAGLLFEF